MVQVTIDNKILFLMDGDHFISYYAETSKEIDRY